MFPIGGGLPAVPTKFTAVEESFMYFLLPTSYVGLPIADSEDSIISKSVWNFIMIILCI